MSLIPKVSLMAIIFWSMMYCVPLNGVFHPGAWPRVCGLVTWGDIGVPHRPQKRLPGTSGWPQEVQTELVINWNPSAVGCSGSKRELCLLKRQRGEALMRREVDSLRPLFFLEHFLSGSDCGRDRVIRARIRLEWTVYSMALSTVSERCLGIMRTPFHFQDQG